MSEQVKSTDGKTSPNAAKRKLLFKRFAVIVAVIAVIYFIYWFFVGSHYVSTDNAYVGAEIAQVTPSVGGTVQSVNVTDTQSVKKGDVLVVIDKIDAELALARANAELARAQTDFERAEIDYKRRSSLSKSGSVSGEELTNSENGYKTAKAMLDAATAANEQAKVNYERTTITAPIDGVIANRRVQLGQRVEMGTPLLSIVPITKVHVDANFKEGQLKNVKIGQSAKLEADIYGGKIEYHGKVAGISGGTGSAFALIPAQNATGNWIKVVQRLPVRIELDPAELEKHPLQVGLSMEVTIDTSAKVNEGRAE